METEATKTKRMMAAIMRRLGEREREDGGGTAAGSGCAGVVTGEVRASGGGGGHRGGDRNDMRRERGEWGIKWEEMCVGFWGLD